MTVTHSKPRPLCPAQLLLIEGADAGSFAHAQFTSDVASLADGAWQWSAWLDAQGRVRHFFALARIEPTQLMLWLPLGDAAAMRDALSRYVLRSRLSLATPSSWVLHAVPIDDACPTPGRGEVRPHAAGYVLRIPGGSERLAWLAPSDESRFDEPAVDAWRAADIAAGLPLIAGEVSSEFVPQALDLERVDAIRFDKGCYPGQEIAARLHFRGGNKRRLRRVDVDGPPLQSGDDLLVDGGSRAGRVLYAASANHGRSTALAVISDESSVGQNLATTGGIVVRPHATEDFSV